jgi:SulP family sulfate permease
MARSARSTGAQAAPSPHGLARVLPILSWLPAYHRAWLRPDLIAGLAVAALVVPKSLGYAGIAGVPLQYGLYAAAAGALIYALFGTSRQIATGPSSALAAVAAGAVLGAGASGDDAVRLVASITLVTGVLFVALAVFKMGWISQFLSKAVITGFLFGAGGQVAISELAGITGTPADGDNSWETLASWLGGLGDTDTTTLAVGLVSLAVVFGLRFAAPRVPGALVLVVGGLVASAALDLADRGVAVVGDVPAGLPSVVLPDVGFMVDNGTVILTAALALLLIGFSQTAGDAREFASRHRYQVDINQESLAQGMSNLGTGLVQGIPVSASLSSSSLNDQSGAKSPLASLTTGSLVVLTLLFLAPVFSDLPTPVLSALIIEAVVMGMMDVAGMRRLYRVKRSDFWIAMAALLGVLGAGVMAGVVIGIVLSMVWMVYVSAVPAMPVLGLQPGTRVFRSVGTFPDGRTYPGVLVLGFDAGLFFIDADALQDRIRQEAHDASPPLTLVVVDFEGVNYIDSQGSDAVARVNDLAQAHGAELRLARVKPAILDVLTADRVVDRLGDRGVSGTVYDAVADRVAPPDRGSDTR